MIDVKNMIPIERDFSTNIALENVLDVIQELQLRPRIDFLNEQAQVTNLKLLDLDGNIVSEGSGKGELICPRIDGHLLTQKRGVI